MKRKHGFTIAELVIVIAVIGILAAILIPTLTLVINNAKMASDLSLVKNMNTCLELDNKEHKTMYNALTAIKGNGIEEKNVKNLALGDEQFVAWDRNNDRFVLVSKSDDSFVYPKNDGDEKGIIDNYHDYFAIFEKVPASSNQKYSIYLSEEAKISTLTVSVGFDAGNNNRVTSLTYDRHEATSSRDVLIRTNAGTACTYNGYVDGEGNGDSIYHYGEAGSQRIDCANLSFHEHGGATENIVDKGHYVQEKGSIVAVVEASATNGDVDVELLRGSIQGTVKNTNESNEVSIKSEEGVTTVSLEAKTDGGTLNVDLASQPTYSNTCDKEEIQEEKSIVIHGVGDGVQGKENQEAPASHIICPDGHDYILVAGYSVKVCSRCGAYEYSEPVIYEDSHQHQEEEEEELPTENTYTINHNGNGEMAEPVKVHEHNFGGEEDIVWTWKENVYDKVTAYFSCLDEDCNQTETVIVPVENGSLSSSITVAPTCTESGERTYTAQLTHHNIFFEDSKVQVVSELGHDYVAEVTAPTCTEGGYTTHTCSRCGDSYVDSEVEALGHDIIHHEAKIPTSTEVGWDAYDTCSRCDYSTYNEIPAIRFKTKFVNNDKYMYRVGNKNEVKLGYLFGTTSDNSVNSSDVDVTFENKQETDATFTKNNNDWANSTIQFSGAGVIRVNLIYENHLAETLDLEVIDATNAIAAMDATSGNVCLLCDIQVAVYSMTVSNGYWLCGNGFKLIFTGIGSQGSTNVSNYGVSFITVNGGTLDNVQVICPLYSKSTGSIPGDNPPLTNGTFPYIMPAINAKGNAVIQNCYVYGARTNIFSTGGNITIKDTVCELGATANIQLWSNSDYTVTLDNVTTIQYLNNGNKIYGFGILNGHNESPSNAKLVIKNKLTQYNWVTSSDISSLDSLVARKAIEEALNHNSYQHTYNNKTYINLGIAYLNNNGHEIFDERDDLTGYEYCALQFGAGVVSYYGGVYSIRSGYSDVQLKDNSNEYQDSYNGIYQPQMRFNADLGGQLIEYNPDNDEYCYIDNAGTLKIMILKGDDKYLNLASILSVAKYNNQNITINIQCKDTNNNNVSVTDGCIDLYEENDYIVTYQIIDNIIYDLNGNLTNSQKVYYVTIPITVTLKDAAVSNAEFEFDKTKQIFYYTGSSTAEVQVLPLLNGLKIYDYDLNNERYLRFNGDAQEAYKNIVTISHNNDSTAQYCTTIFTFADGGNLEMKYYSRAESGSSTYTTTIKLGNDGKLYAVNNGTTKNAYAIYWAISYYKFTGNNGTEIIVNGNTSTSTNVTTEMKNTAVNKASSSHTVERLDRSTVMAFNSDGTPVGLVFTGSTAISCYKVDSSLNSKTAYIYKYGKFEEKTSVSMSSYSVSIANTVTFNANGGKCAQTIGYSSNTNKTVKLPTASRTGFMFDGWYTEAIGGTKRGNAGDAYTPNANETLYAHWKSKFKVTFNVNGGSSLSQSYVNEYSGDSITLPITTQELYWLEGWYDGDTKVGVSGGNYVVPEKNVTLTARWSPKYTVTFNSNGGTSVNNMVYQGAELELPSSTHATMSTFEGWFTSPTGGTRVGGIGSSYVPAADVTLYAQWSNNIPVSFDANGGECDIDGGTYDGVNPIVLPSATKVGHVFNGWYTASSGGTKVGNAGDSYMPTAGGTIYAQWTAYVVTYNANGGSVSPSSAGANDSGQVTLPSPTKTGHTFNGWYNAPSGGTKVGNANASYSVTANITLYAQWTIKTSKITISTSNSSTAVTVNGSTVNSGGSVVYDSVVKVVLSYTQTSSLKFTIKKGSTNVAYYSNEACTSSTTSTAAGTYYFKMPDGDVTITSSSTSSCLAPETLIMLADGSYKEVQYIEPGDELLVINHETGKLETSFVLFNDVEDEQLFEVINLEFSNGKTIKVISEHGFFDLDLMKYVYIDATNYNDYLGHNFYGINGNYTLENAYLTYEVMKVYSPVTYSTLNYFVEDMLSMPGGISGLFNYFEYDENLQYNQEKKNSDIEQFGLFTIEELGEVGVTQIMFDAYNGQYLKVAMGKGLLTEEYLFYLIERYSVFTE